MFIKAQNYCSRLLQCTEAMFRFVNLLTINLPGGREGMQGNYHEVERIQILCSVFVVFLKTCSEMSVAFCRRLQSLIISKCSCFSEHGDYILLLNNRMN